MPLVLNHSRAVFLHVPKTGGTWVRFALRRAGVAWLDWGPQHANLAESSDLFPGAPRFAAVRHPHAWYASYWVMKQIEGWGAGWLLDDCISDNFDKFVRTVIIKHPGFLANLYDSFVGEGVRVMRNRTLAEDLCAALDDFGEPFDRCKLASTPRVHMGASLDVFRTATTWEPETAMRLYESEKAVFDRFGYKGVIPS